MPHPCSICLPSACKCVPPSACPMASATAPLCSTRCSRLHPIAEPATEHFECFFTKNPPTDVFFLANGSFPGGWNYFPANVFAEEISRAGDYLRRFLGRMALFPCGCVALKNFPPADDFLPGGLYLSRRLDVAGGWRYFPADVIVHRIFAGG